MVERTKRIFLHVGMHKTGTTAIQEFLELNHESLLDKGYCVPLEFKNGIGGNNLHHLIPVKLGFGRYNAGKDPDSVLQILLEKLKDIKIDNIIISSEVFSEVCGLSTVEELGGFFRGYSVKIIIYVRRQDYMLESMYRQVVKDGHWTGEISSFPTNWADYYRKLRVWSEVFGKNNIIVRPYEKDQFTGGTIFHDFLASVGLDMADEYKLPPRDSNPRLSNNCLEFKRFLNLLLCNKEASNQYNDFLLNYSRGENPGSERAFSGRSLVDDKSAVELVNRCADTNRKVAVEYLGRSDGQLFLEKGPSQESDVVGKFHLDAATVEKILGSLYEEDRQKLYEIFSNVYCRHVQDQELENLIASTFGPAIKAILAKINRLNLYERVNRFCAENDVMSEDSDEKRLFSKFYLPYKLFKKQNFDSQLGSYVKVNLVGKLKNASKHVMNLEKTRIDSVAFESRGNDPFIVFSNIKVGGSEIYCFSFIVNAPAKTKLKLYYLVNGCRKYTKERSRTYNIDNGLNKLQFVIDDKDFNGVLRIDPGEVPGRYTIEKIICVALQ